MNTDELIKKIDDKLLELSEAPNTKKYKWFDFNAALRKLNEQFEKEGYNDYHKRIAGQYINVFNDLYNWHAETVGISCIAYNAKTKVATMQKITNVNYGVSTHSIDTYEQKIDADRHSHYEALKLPESPYATRYDVVMIDYLLRDCKRDFTDYEGAINPFETQMIMRRIDERTATFNQYFPAIIDVNKYSMRFERYIKLLKSERKMEDTVERVETYNHKNTTPLFTEYLLSRIHKLCNEVQFESITSDEFKDAMNDPANNGDKLVIRNGEMARVYHLIRNLKKKVANEDKSLIWLKDILAALNVKESTYKRKYTDVGNDDLNPKNKSFKGSLEQVLFDET